MVKPKIHLNANSKSHLFGLLVFIVFLIFNLLLFIYLYSLEKQKRKKSIHYNLTHCKESIINLEISSDKSSKAKENIVLYKVTKKMAKLWNEDGYRELNSRVTAKKKTSNVHKKRNNVNPGENNVENNENLSQVSSQTCARQAMYDYCDSSVTELAAYLDEALFIPRKMSFMAEMMYT